MSKKSIIAIIVVVLLVAAVAIGAFFFMSPEKNVEGSLEEIMTKLYAGIGEDELPMMLGNIEVAKEDIQYYIGTDEVNYKEALVSESGVGSIAHSVVLLRLNDSADAENVVSKVKASADPRKWLCVEAENVIVKSKGDLVVLIMSNELAPKLEENFDGLK